MSSVQKGYLKNETTGTVKKFIYNPNSISESRDVNFSTIIAPGCSYPKFQYVNGGAKSLNISLFLDGKTSEVQGYLDFLESLLPPKKTGGSFSTPPTVLFAFGKTICRCILTSLDINKTEFMSNLDVRQATVTLNFMEVV